MKNELEMSMMSEVNYFLRLQINQRNDGIFLKQIIALENAKISRTPMATTTELDGDEHDRDVDIKLCRSMIESLYT